MTDSLVFYTMGIEIPFNEETSRGWSKVRDISEDFINAGVEKIENVIRVNDCIPLARIFRIFAMKEQPMTPNVFFEKLDEVNVSYDAEDHSFVISMYLSGGYMQEPYRKKDFQPQVLKGGDYDGDNTTLTREKITEINADGKAVAGRYPWGKPSYEQFIKEHEHDAEGKLMHEESEAGECQTGPKEISDSGENGKT